MIPPGQPYTTTVKAASSSDIECKSGTEVVYPDIIADGEGKWKLEFDAEDIKCPGPLKIYVNGNLVEEQQIGPCE